MEEFGVRIIRSLPRSPETGGRFERLHATLKDILGMVLRERCLPLDEALEEALSIYKLVLLNPKYAQLC